MNALLVWIIVIIVLLIIIVFLIKKKSSKINHIGSIRTSSKGFFQKCCERLGIK